MFEKGGAKEGWIFRKEMRVIFTSSSKQSLRFNTGEPLSFSSLPY